MRNKEIRPQDVSADLYLAQELDKAMRRIRRLERKSRRNAFVGTVAASIYLYIWVKSKLAEEK